jgi:hypothetical protein
MTSEDGCWNSPAPVETPFFSALSLVRGGVVESGGQVSPIMARGLDENGSYLLNPLADSFGVSFLVAWYSLHQHTVRGGVKTTNWSGRSLARMSLAG